MQETPSASNLNPDLHEQMTSSPFVAHSCEQPPLDGLSHGWTGNKRKELFYMGVSTRKITEFEHCVLEKYSFLCEKE